MIAASFAALLLAAQAAPPAAPELPTAAMAPAGVVTAAPTVAADRLLQLRLSTGGPVVIQLFPDVAPKAVERVRTLADRGFYDGVLFHRVIDGFMAQTGDPTGTGEGGSELPDLPAEFGTVPHLRGTVAMARTADPNSANSQFYIMFLPTPSLDGKYTVIGRVIAGMEHVDALARGEPPEAPDRIVSARTGAPTP